MKSYLVVPGLLLGAVAGLALIAFNPLAQDVRTVATSGPGYHSYTTSDVYGMHRSADGMLNFAWLLRGPGDYDEAAIRNTLASIMVLRDERGEPVAFATRLSATEQKGSLLKATVGLRSSWNVFFPNQGSVYMTGFENHSDIVTDGLWSAMSGGGFHARGERYELTPDEPGFESRIVGVSGAYADSKGSYQEAVLSPGGDVQVQQGEIILDIQR